MKKNTNIVPETFYEGKCDDAYLYMGCHRAKKNNKNGFLFRVWAPCALSVRVVGDFNFWNTEELLMQKNMHGVWEIFSEYAKIGDKYKYYIQKPDGYFEYKSDPYAFAFAALPDNSSVVYDYTGYKWGDYKYKTEQKKKNIIESPVNIYELHLGSWKCKEDGSCYSYAEIAEQLIPYVKKMGYTHIELMPITEYPFDPSWGYQVTGYYAPTFRYGTPVEFMKFIDKCHQSGIGVILDWVPAHFPKDAYGLYEFDGTCCYEVNDPEMNEHPDWNTRIFDYSRHEVRSFLKSSALFWIREYHIDGIRVDAVASMLYLDYGREKYKPNMFGGNYNLHAIDFLKELNECAFRENPSVMMIAEESTAFPMVSKPTYDGGLGFNFKWNMGWMNDMLSYMSKDPLFRKWSHNDLTFSLTYAFSENFILPLSHDEIVHGKCSMIGKMPGEYDAKFDNLRTFYAYRMAHPGKKLTFMGNEFAQFIEWDFKRPLDWFLLEYEKHDKFHDYVKDLNKFYLNNSPFWENDGDWNGFSWISADDASQSIVAFRRIDKAGDEVICIFNFCPVTRERYRLGLPEKSKYKCVFSTDRAKYGGHSVRCKTVKAECVSMHGYEYSGEFTIPAMSAVYYKKEKNELEGM